MVAKGFEPKYTRHILPGCHRTVCINLFISYCVLLGYPPFYALSDREIFQKIAKGFTPKVLPSHGAWFPISLRASDGVRDLIARLLVTDPKKRLTAQEALGYVRPTCSLSFRE